MHANTQGIVLRRVSYSGSSVIANIYTRKFGTVPFLFRGVGKKGGKSAALQPLSRVEVTTQFKEKNEVQFGTGIQLLQGSFHHGGNPEKISIALFIAEVLYKCLREESPDPDLFDFINASLEYFEDTPYYINFHLKFLTRLSKFFGFQPQGLWSTQEPFFDLLNGVFTHRKHASLHMLDTDEAASLSKLIQLNFQDEIKLSNASRRKLLYGLVEYYQLQLEGFGSLKSLPIMMEIFAE
ncbi:MAG TPA: DNA repair protein RecO [Cryomorphaceae bacterium]|nr:DNA repair protein RecO [Cryomorphaceae bacterium]